MNELEALDNKLNNVTCPIMIDSLIYKRKSVEINWKIKTEELRQEELKSMRQKESIIERLKRIMK